MRKFLLFIMICACWSCNHRQQKSDNVREVKPGDVFPVGSFIAEQVRQVDSLNPPLIKTVTVNDKTETSVASQAEFQALAREFLESDISDSASRRKYKETSFADQSAPNVTLTYSTEDKSLEVQRVDVIIKPDTLLNDKVANVYIEKFISRNDSSIQKKLLWKSDKNLQVITTSRAADGASVTSQLKISWEKQF